MELTTLRTSERPVRRAAVNGLAIVGFIVLILIGMALAIYAATFVPSAISRIGSAAVYFSSAFQPNTEDTDLVVVPPTETVPFGDDIPAATTTPPATETPDTTPVTPTPGTPVTRVVQVGTTPAPLFGLPDLVIENITTGYLTSSDTDTFRASSRVPDGERGAVKFTIANRGTNISGRFEFDAELPTSRSYTFHSGKQESLKPGERIDYVLGFDQTREGDDREITIVVDPDRDISESNEGNNSRSVRIDIED
ncbi:hypothetical protein KJ819_00305 [Patescibacteria group bacterium]|nr:hypothetical protein [Patescibacteria group bacterium]MBU1501078.1 hypothetical protein [Patescibacteria group bacterium]MBU2081049.1 hypothetical protein [Patescibacteria group bacterium]MBU2124140.1 hypothetical protein [Patescibacteria group bacterium]MBU2194996.1 hypothetical protein [Patescibacteria group bacterium]